MIDTSPLLYIILNQMRSETMAFVTVDSSSVTSMTPERAKKINDEVPDRLAKFFYINKSNKVSYYRKDAWGCLETWNKGSNSWEYCPGMSAATIFKLPAVPYVDRTEAAVEVVKVSTTPKVTTSKVVSQTYTSQYPQLDKEAISKKAKELAIKNVHDNLMNRVAIDNLFVVPQSNKTDLRKLIEKHNIHKYPTTFVEGENNYAFAYIFEKGLWELQPRINYMAGAITVTSKTCAKLIIKELNDLGIKPDQIA